MSGQSDELSCSTGSDCLYFKCLISRANQWRSLNVSTNMLILYYLFYFDVFGVASVLELGGNRPQVLSIIALIGLLVVFLYENFHQCPFRICPDDCRAMRKKLADPFYVYSYTEKREVPKRWSVRVLVSLFMAVSFASAISVWEVIFCPWMGSDGSYRPSIFLVSLTIMFPSLFWRVSRLALRCR